MLDSRLLVNYVSPTLNIGKRIREARARAGITQRVLAERADLTREYVLKLESGELDNPTIKTLDAIAKALKVRVTDLIS